MKMNPYSYNGQPLGRDQFAWIWKKGAAGQNPESMDAIVFPCPNKVGGICIQKVTLGAPVADTGGNRWHWDGNMEAPTLSPSIGCDLPRRCGWHGHIVNGGATP